MDLISTIKIRFFRIQKGCKITIFSRFVSMTYSNSNNLQWHRPKMISPPHFSLSLHHQSPCAFIASATLRNPAMLLPATKLGNSPSAGSIYSFAVSSPALKQASMIPFSLLSTSSSVQAVRCEFWAISSPDTATPPAFAALPVGRRSVFAPSSLVTRLQ